MTTNKDFDNFIKFLEEKKKFQTEDGASIADKLNPFLAPGSRDSKTGEYKPKDPDVEYGKKDLAADLASVGPPVTSIPGAAYGTYRSLQRGEYGQAALNALGVIPGVGLLTKGTKLAGAGEKIAKVTGHADVAGSLGSVGKDVYDATRDNEPKPIQSSTPSEPKKVKPINIPNEPTSTKIEPKKVQPIKIQPESGGKIKMTDKKKSISEALAEVQRNAELKKIEEAKNVWGDALDENILMERGSSRASKIKDWFKGKNADVNPPSGRPGDNAKDITGKAKEIKPDTSTGKTKIEPAKPAEAPKSGGLASKILGFGLGAGLGTVVGDKLANKMKDAEPSAAMNAPSEPEKPKDSPKSDDMTFGQAFAAARKAATEKGAKSTGQFSWHGKDYQTNIQGKGTPKAPEEKYVAPSKQTKVDIGTKASAPAAETPAAAPTPTPPKQSSGETYTNGREPGWRDTPPQPASPAPNAFQGSTKDTTPIGPDPTKFTKPESESGGKKKKMSEETNPLIAAFFKLQESNPQNMFEAAKKAKKDYDKDGKIESPKDEVWGSRFAAAKKAGKMEEANIDPVVTGSSSVTKSKTGYVDPSTPTEPYKKAPVSTAAGDVLDKAKNALDKTGVKEEAEQEVTFSQAEIDHINSFFLEASVAPNRPEVATGADSVSDKMSQNDVTGTSTESGGKKKVKEEVELDETSKPEVSVYDNAAHVKDKMGKVVASYSKKDHGADYMKKANAHMSKIKEEVELEEGDLTIRTLYNKWAGHASGYHEKSGAKANAVEKAITKVHGPKVMSHLKKALNANLQGNFDRENSHFEKARTAAGKSEMIGATVGSGRSEFRKTNEEALQEGRPKKKPEPESTERDARQHIQVMAGRAAAGNVLDFKHNNGSVSKLTPGMGRSIIAHLNKLKPSDRQTAVNKMHDSPEGLKV